MPRNTGPRDTFADACGELNSIDCPNPWALSTALVQLCELAKALGQENDPRVINARALIAMVEKVA
jgi:hypothetical protein